MDDMLYLFQSRRLAKIVKQLIGASHWTNYSAWEYSYSARDKFIELNLAYNTDWNLRRFIFLDKTTRELLMETDSIKVAVKYIKLTLKGNPHAEVEQRVYDEECAKADAEEHEPEYDYEG